MACDLILCILKVSVTVPYPKVYRVAEVKFHNLYSVALYEHGHLASCSNQCIILELNLLDRRCKRPVFFKHVFCNF